jgi:hypothetical protein
VRSASSSDRVLVRSARWVGRTSDHGMVTAELAAALPALVLVVSLLLAVVGTASDASRALDAARSAARSASVGTDEATVTAQAKRLAPDGSSVRIWRDDPWVRVEVVVPGRHWGPVPLPVPRTSAAALLESGVRS